MDVSCDQEEINVILHIYSTLDYDPESVGLNDASCKPSFQNNTHIFAKSSLSGCGTTSYQSKDGRMIVYSNAIHAVVRSKKSIGPYATRDHQAVFEFHCRYNRRAIISIVSFDPSKMLIVTDIGKHTDSLKTLCNSRIFNRGIVVSCFSSQLKNFP